MSDRGSVLHDWWQHLRAKHGHAREQQRHDASLNHSEIFRVVLIHGSSCLHVLAEATFFAGLRTPTAKLKTLVAGTIDSCQARPISSDSVRDLSSGGQFDLIRRSERGLRQQKTLRPYAEEFKNEEWSGRADSNCRPLAPQASALPG